jgi:hypothetical protein
MRGMRISLNAKRRVLRCPKPLILLSFSKSNAKLMQLYESVLHHAMIQKKTPKQNRLPASLSPIPSNDPQPNCHISNPYQSSAQLKERQKLCSLISSNIHVREILDYYLSPGLLVVVAESNSVVDTVEKAIPLALEAWRM